MPQPSVFFRRDLYERVGGLNRSLKFCMDYDLWARFAVGGGKFVGIDADLSGNRWYATTKTAAHTLDLYAEVVTAQRSIFGAVSPYYVQAVSDYLYSKFEGKRNKKHHLLSRWLYFKGLWVAMNARKPSYCLKGLLSYSLAKSGPVVGDHMTLRDWARQLVLPLKSWARQLLKS